MAVTGGRNEKACVTQQAAGDRRRQLFVAELVSGPDDGHAYIGRCCAAAGVQSRTFYTWKERYPDWAAMVNGIRQKQRVETQARRALHPKGVEAVEWDGSFADFRRVFLGRTFTPWFHARAVEMIEKAEPGSITLFLWPPGHGKTALIEDYCTFKLATDPAFLITVGSEKEGHARKVIGLVKQRMEDSTPGFELMRRKFGPFAPPKGLGEHNTQPWAAGFFNVFKKPSGEDRDYSMAALGMGGSVIGTRTDLLIVDDPQSRKSLNITNELVEIFRQDWLSRPMAGGSKGTPGKTVIIMNRVGDLDFADKVEREELVDNVIRVRADRHPDPTQQWAWPEKYTERDYMKMKKNVGDDAWARNFLQIARPPGTQTFTEKMVKDCANPLRSIIHDAPKGDDNNALHVEVACDPGYGMAAVVACGFTQKKLYVLAAIEIPNLVSPEQIWDMIEEQIHTWTKAERSVVTDVVIEENAFQKGMQQDDRSLEMRRRFGVKISPHQTRMDKNDDDIGIPQMAMAMRRREIDFPAWDEVSRRRMAPLYEQLYTYRAFVKGSKLRMDMIMPLWFLWRRWRAQRRVALTNPNSFDFQGLKRRIPVST